MRVIRSGASSVDHTARLTEELATVALLVVVLSHPMCTGMLPSARSSMTADREVEEAVPAAHDGGEVHECIGADGSAGQQVTCRIALVFSGAARSASIASAVGRISSSTPR